MTVPGAGPLRTARGFLACDAWGCGPNADAQCGQRAQYRVETQPLAGLPGGTRYRCGRHIKHESAVLALDASPAEVAQFEADLRRADRLGARLEAIEAAEGHGAANRAFFGMLTGQMPAGPRRALRRALDDEHGE